MSDGTVVIGTIGSDCHIVGNMIISRSLEMAGFKVVQLGACVDQQEFIDAATETNANAILVSSMYGMGYFDCEGLRDKCTESGLEDIVMYIGGFLSVEDENDAHIEQRYKSIGFDRVYFPSTNPHDVVVDLRADIQAQRKG